MKIRIVFTRVVVQILESPPLCACRSYHVVYTDANKNEGQDLRQSRERNTCGGQQPEEDVRRLVDLKVKVTVGDISPGRA